MQAIYTYKPIQFFLYTFLLTWVPWLIAAYFSHQKGKEKLQLLFIFPGLVAPFLVALVMIYASNNQMLIKDFWERLLLYKIHWSSLALIVLVIPFTFFLATAISLLFGKSVEQFKFATDFNVMKGWQLLSLLIPLFLAPALEELGWRGYGVDSLRSRFDLFSTTMLFAFLWGLWHLPLFFIKGYYHYELRNLNMIYVINFFISMIPAAILLNWIYYQNSRSILIVILAHAMLNACSILFKTEPFTKCIVTILLCLVSVGLILKDWNFFFRPSLNQLVKTELKLLREKYHFPGATFAYILPDGRMETAEVGFHDLETKTKMTSDSRMLAASIGKTFVAATVLQLAKQGDLNLDDPLSKWLGDRPWFSRLPNHSTMTLRHLLTHSSGLPDHVHMDSFLQNYSQNWKKPGDPFPPESLIAFVLDHPPLFKAGQGWMYTDTGYLLLGLVIEKATKNTYYQEVENRFLNPLELNNTSPSNQPTLHHLAAGYTKENNPFGLPSKTLIHKDLMAWNPSIEWTGGGLISTSQDLAKWAKLLYEGRAMNEEYLSEMLKSVPIEKNDSGLYFGAGVSISKKDPLGLVYGHMGVIPGYISSIRYFPKYPVVCAFQINTDKGVFDRSTNLFKETEERLAKVVIDYVKARPKNALIF